MYTIQDMADKLKLSKQGISHRILVLGITPIVPRRRGRNGTPAYYSDNDMKQVTKFIGYRGREKRV